MNTVQHFEYADRRIATVIKAGHPTDGVEFFTAASNPLQVGGQLRAAGSSCPPHVHVGAPGAINQVQEVIYVVTGKVRLTLYSADGKVIDATIMGAGDSVILMEEGHGLDFLEDTRLFEVKQGPYPGTANAKIHLGQPVGVR